MDWGAPDRTVFLQRWWDYSGKKGNLDGYICLSASVFWGVLGFVMVTWGNDLLFRLMALLPLLLVKILLLVLAGLLVVDILASYILLRGYGNNIRQWEEADNRIRKVTLRLQNWIGTVIARRIRKAYPKAAETKIEEKEAAKKDMEQMLDYIDTLNELDTTGIEPMSHVFPVQNVFREDVVTNGDNKEATLANAPLRKEDSFEVPKTIG